MPAVPPERALDLTLIAAGRSIDTLRTMLRALVEQAGGRVLLDQGALEEGRRRGPLRITHTLAGYELVADVVDTIDPAPVRGPSRVGENPTINRLIRRAAQHAAGEHPQQPEQTPGGLAAAQDPPGSR